MKIAHYNIWSNFLSCRLSVRRALIAVAISFSIIVSDYIISNISFPIFDSSNSLGLQAYFKDYSIDTDAENFLFPINTGVDKQLVEVRDEFDEPIGHTAITDREKLLEFLQIASKADYRYIFLDIRFEEGLTTPCDSLLFATISTMPKVAYSRHRAIEDDNRNPAMLLKGAYADYRSTYSEGFSRYEFLQSGNESVALKLYSEIDNGFIQKRWFGYQDKDGSLCYNTQFIPFPKSVLYKYDENGQIRYPYLGAQVLGKHSEEELLRMMKDKIIVVGDFDEDLHGTYIGAVPGPLLSFYAYLMLKNGGHKVNILLQIFMLVIYSVVTYIILSPGNKRQARNPVLVLVYSLLGWGCVLWVLKSLLYWLFGLSFLVVIPTFIFSAIATVKEIANQLNYLKSCKSEKLSKQLNQ